MFSAKSISTKGNSHSAKTANISRSCLIYLVSASCLPLTVWKRPAGTGLAPTILESQIS